MQAPGDTSPRLRTRFAGWAPRLRRLASQDELVAGIAVPVEGPQRPHLREDRERLRAPAWNTLHVVASLGCDLQAAGREGLGIGAGREDLERVKARAARGGAERGGSEETDMARRIERHPVRAESVVTPASCIRRDTDDLAAGTQHGETGSQELDRSDD